MFEFLVESLLFFQKDVLLLLFFINLTCGQGLLPTLEEFFKNMFSFLFENMIFGSFDSQRDCSIVRA